MKKLVSLIVALCIVCVGSVVFAEDETILGEWYSYYLDHQLTLIFTEEGSASLLVDSEQFEDGSWMELGDHYSVTWQECDDGFQTEPVVVSGDRLVFGTDYASIVYKRELELPVEIAPVNTQAESSDFSGQWNLVAIDMDGLTPAAAMNMDGVAISIDSNRLSFDSASQSGLFDLVDGDAIAMVYQDGKLIDQMEVDLGDDHIIVQFSCSLLENGLLAFEIDDQMVHTTMYFTRNNESV